MLSPAILEQLLFAHKEMPLRQGILEDLVDVTEMARHMQPISFPGDSANHHSISNCLLCFQSAMTTVSSAEMEGSVLQLSR